MEASELKALEEKLQPKHRYAQALAFAFPFFIGMAVLWLFLKADLDRQLEVFSRGIEVRLKGHAEAGGSDVQAKLFVVNFPLMDLRDHYSSDSREEFKDRLQGAVARLRSSLAPGALVKVTVVDLTGRVLIGDSISPEDLKQVRSTGMLTSLDAGNNNQLLVRVLGADQLPEGRRLALGYAISSADKSISGAVISILEGQYFDFLANSIAGRANSFISIVSDSGTYIWRAATDTKGKLLSTPGPAFLDTEALVRVLDKTKRLDKTGILRVRQIRGENEPLYGWGMVEGYPLYIFSGELSSLEFEGYNLLKSKYVLFGIIISILFIASLYWFFAFRFSSEKSLIQRQIDYEIIRESEQNLAASRQLLRELATHQIALKEEERKRISLEIHDELGQRLTALRLEVAMMMSAEAVRRKPDEIIESLANLKAQIDEILAIVRNVAVRLRPPALDVSFESAVMGLLEDFRRSVKIEVQLTNTLSPHLHLSDTQATTLFRIIQESLTNIARHAQASHVEIMLSSIQDGFFMKIKDDGVGFNPSDIQGARSLGLSGIRERAIALGGDAEFHSELGVGTEIRVRIPLAASGPVDMVFLDDNNRLSNFRSE